jgi:hypothetical protein
MKKFNFNFIIICVILAANVFISCNASKKQHYTQKDKVGSHILPKTIIYKTTNDYTNYVPVMLDNAKQKLISYPDPTDTYTGTGFMTPQLLAGGFLLDKRGITINSVFTNYTYSEYSQMKAVPSPQEILNNIKDKNPLTALYQCPLTTDTTILNQWIQDGLEKYCKKIK